MTMAWDGSVPPQPGGCPRCGGAVGCGVAGPEPCWCFARALTPELRTRLAASYTECLCSACLAELQAQEAQKKAGGVEPPPA
jgi:hypothetical protein